MVYSIKSFLQIYKYATAKFTIINGLMNRFSDRNKCMGYRTFVPETKLKWVEYY